MLVVEGEHVAAGREGTQVIKRAVVPDFGPRGDPGGAVGRRTGQDAEADAEPDGGLGGHPGQLAGAYHAHHRAHHGAHHGGRIGRLRGSGHARYPTGPAGAEVSWASTTVRSVDSSLAFAFAQEPAETEARDQAATRKLTFGIHQGRVADL